MTFFWIRSDLGDTWSFGMGPFHDCTPWQDLSNGLSSDPNGDHMQTLRPREVGIPTYHFETCNIVGDSSSRVLFRVLFPYLLYVKNSFGLFVILTWWMRVVVTSPLRDKLPPIKGVLLFYNLYSFCNFTLVIESKLIVSLCCFHIFVCIISFSHKSESVVSERSALHLSLYACPRWGQGIRSWVSK